VSCFPEATYAIYVDGELAADEAHRVEAHLSGCSRCRDLVKALRAENRLLTEALLEVEQAPSAEPVPAGATRPLDVLWTGLAVLAAATGLETAWNLLSGFEAPAGVNWLNPFSVTVQWNLFFTSLFYFVEEGAVMLLSNVIVVGLFALTLAMIAATAVYMWRRPSTVSLLATLALAFIFAAPATAIDHRSGTRVNIGAGETLDDTLLAHADYIRIDGVVTGNVISFANELTITGTVKGDVVAFCKTFNLDGTVEGNVYAFSQWSSIRGHVGNSVTTFVQQARLSDAAHIDSDLLMFVDEVNLDGNVARDVYVFGDRVFVRGSIGRNLRARVARLTLLAASQVGGDLFARVKKEKDLHIDPGATVVGKTEVKLPAERPSRFLRAKFYIWEAVWLAAAFILGLLLHWLFPALFQSRPQTPVAFLRTLGLGFLVLVATPVAAIIVAITVIGMPLAVISLVLLLLGVYLAKVFVAAFVGQALTSGREGQPPAFALRLLLGLVILFVAMNLPYLGGWIAFLVILLGLGMSAMQVYRAWRRPAATAAA
jgi:predicted anti-sigma-YlaC factor YlaD